MTKRPYSRQTLYPCGASSTVDTETSELIDSIAESSSLPRAAVIRQAIMKGLPALRKSIDKQPKEG